MNDLERTILIIENSSAQQLLIRNKLQKAGYNPVLFSDVPGGMEYLETQRTDGIICDLMLPSMGGVQFCQAVKTDNRFRHIPVICFTLSNDDELLTEAEHVFDSCVSKSHGTEALIKELEHCLERESRYDILLVEDSRPQIMCLERLLNKHSISHQVCYDSNEAFSVIENNPPSLVISHISLPNMDGIHLSRQIKSLSPGNNIPVILYGSIHEIDFYDVLSSNADYFLPQPLNEQLFVKKIQAALASSHGAYKPGPRYSIVPIDGNGESVFTVSHAQMLEFMETLYQTVNFQIQEIRNIRKQKISPVQQEPAAAAVPAKPEDKNRDDSIPGALSDLLWEWHISGHTIHCEPSFWQFLGKNDSDTDISPHEWENRIHPDDVNRAQNDIQTAFEIGVMRWSEYRLRMEYGDWVWVVRRGKVVKIDQNGHPLIMSGHLMIMPVAGSHLDHSRRNNDTGDIEYDIKRSTMFEWDIYTNQAYYSSNLKSMLGYEPDELNSSYHAWIQLIHPTMRESIKHQIDHYKRDDKLEFSALLRSKGGDWTWIYVKAFIVGRDQNGEPSHILGVQIDDPSTSTRVQSADSLDDRWSSMQFLAKLGYFEYDMLENKINWSEGMFRILQVHSMSDPLTFEQFYDYVHDEDRDNYLAVHHEVVKRRLSFYQCSFRVFLESDKIKHCMEFGRYIYDQDGNPVKKYGALQDVSRQKQQEVQGRALSNMDMISRFAGHVTQEFNNLFHIIFGYTSLMKDNSRKPNQRMEYLDSMIKATERAVTLVREYGRVGGFTDVNGTEFYLSYLIECLSPGLNSLLGENGLVEIKKEPIEYPVFADPLQIEQVLLSICLNSQNHEHQDYRLNISLKMADFTEMCQVNPAVLSEPFMMLSIMLVDKAGNKMLPDRLVNTLFSEQAAKELDTGLAAIYTLIKQNGGFMRVCGEQNSGDNLNIYLPAKKNNAAKLKAKEFKMKDVKGTDTIL
ncbi:MAG: PAS domain-containing protein [candidate division KSB1 bacterium]|nr:PAS domain-containing protein [candidate division KSB1 bacterium]